MRLRVCVAVVMMVCAACGRLHFDALGGAEPSDGARSADGTGAGDGPGGSGGMPITSGLVGYWPLDEGSGAVSFADLSGNGNTGTCTNGCPVAGQPGVRGLAAHFDGDGESIDIGSPPSITGIDKGLTIAGWVNLDSYGGFGYILSNDRDCNGCGGPYQGFSLRGEADKDTFFMVWAGSEPFPLVDGPQIALHEWHFVAGTYDGATMTLYVDGVAAATEADSEGFVVPPSFDTRLGAMGYDNTYDLRGTLDEVMLYDRALSAGEIMTLYQAR